MSVCKFIPALFLPCLAPARRAGLTSINSRTMRLLHGSLPLLSPPLVLRGRVRVGAARGALSLSSPIAAKVIACAISLLIVAGCHHPRHQPLQRYEYKKPEMGTVFQIVLYAPDLAI